MDKSTQPAAPAATPAATLTWARRRVAELLARLRVLAARGVVLGDDPPRRGE